MLPPLDIDRAIETAVREEWGRCLAILAKTTGSLQLAEDCLQDALMSALDHWRSNGLPKVPRAWLLATARHKAIDRLRRDQSFASKQSDIAFLIEQDAQMRAGETDDKGAIPDERLGLMFVCCRPSIDEKSRVALTLRALGGLSVEEIASAFLDTVDAMQRRLSRAKEKIAQQGIKYRVPEASELPARRESVLRTLYLIFNEGYLATRGEGLMRSDLCHEALRLTRVVVQLMPDSVEAQGLLALMLLHDSRRLSRLDAEGHMITLEDQNRARWDKSKIAEGVAILQKILPLGQPGPFQLQAAISAVHATSATWDETDWAQIVQLYGLLYRLEPSPVIAINRAVAMVQSGAVEAALDVLDGIARNRKVERYTAYHLAYAEAYRCLGRREDARQRVSQALETTSNLRERAFLERKWAGYLA